MKCLLRRQHSINPTYLNPEYFVFRKNNLMTFIFTVLVGLVDPRGQIVGCGNNPARVLLVPPYRVRLLIRGLRSPVHRDQGHSDFAAKVLERICGFHRIRGSRFLGKCQFFIGR